MMVLKMRARSCGCSSTIHMSAACLMAPQGHTASCAAISTHSRQTAALLPACHLVKPACNDTHGSLRLCDSSMRQPHDGPLTAACSCAQPARRTAGRPSSRVSPLQSRARPPLARCLRPALSICLMHYPARQQQPATPAPSSEGPPLFPSPCPAWHTTKPVCSADHVQQLCTHLPHIVAVT